MIKDIERVLLSQDEIQAKVAEIGKQITEDFADKDPIFIGVLKGCFIFMADLMRCITIPCKIDFLTASSYRDNTVPTDEVKITKDLTIRDVQGYDILIVEDILDTGRTLQRLTDVLAHKGARSVSICTLLDKPERRDPSVTIHPQYIGATVRNEFVVGYGLDFAQKYRNLPFIGILKPEVYLTSADEVKRSV